MKQNYQSELTDSQWHHLKDFFPAPEKFGRPREVDFRAVVNGILYLLVSGCQWRMIPLSYGKWQTIYYYFAKWKSNGLWFRLHETLRAQERIRQGRKKHPTAGAADSQSVKTTAVASARGFDAGKKILGRKRHLLVDTLGLVITVVVTTACVQDRDGLKKLLKTFGVHRKRLKKVWVDGGYRGEIIEWVKSRCGYG